MFFSTTRRPRAGNKVNLGVERLDERLVPTTGVTATLDARGMLQVMGTPMNDKIEIDQHHGVIKVWVYQDDIQDTDQIPIAGGGKNQISVAEGKVKGIVVVGGAGNDELSTFYVQTKPTWVYGQEGD